MFQPPNVLKVVSIFVSKGLKLVPTTRIDCDPRPVGREYLSTGSRQVGEEDPFRLRLVIGSTGTSSRRSPNDSGHLSAEVISKLSKNRQSLFGFDWVSHD